MVIRVFDECLCYYMRTHTVTSGHFTETQSEKYGKRGRSRGLYAMVRPPVTLLSLLAHIPNSSVKDSPAEPV